MYLALAVVTLERFFGWKTINKKSKSQRFKPTPALERGLAGKSPKHLRDLGTGN